MVQIMQEDSAKDFRALKNELLDLQFQTKEQKQENIKLKNQMKAMQAQRDEEKAQMEMENLKIAEKS